MSQVYHFGSGRDFRILNGINARRNECRSEFMEQMSFNSLFGGGYQSNYMDFGYESFSPMMYGRGCERHHGGGNDGLWWGLGGLALGFLGQKTGIFDRISNWLFGSDKKEDTPPVKHQVPPPAASKPEEKTDDKKVDDKKTEDKKTEDKKPEDKKTEDKKPEDKKVATTVVPKPRPKTEAAKPAEKTDSTCITAADAKLSEVTKELANAEKELNNVLGDDNRKEWCLHNAYKENGQQVVKNGKKQNMLDHLYDKVGYLREQQAEAQKAANESHKVKVD